MPLMHYTELCITNTLVKRKVRWEMDFANRGNRPTQSPQHQGDQQQNDQPSSTQSFQPPQASKKDKKSVGGLGKLGPAIMVFSVTILLVALIVGLMFGGDNNGSKESALINPDKYQAVFLDSPDGQVYFGKLQVYNSDLYALTDIFYVRVEQPIQPEGANQVQQPNISLAKLGNELHGPEDAMFIARSKVLYWENLKDDGQVVEAIKEFDANGRQTNDNTQQQPAEAQQNDAGAASGTQPEGTEEVNDTPTETPTTPTTPTTP